MSLESGTAFANGDMPSHEHPHERPVKQHFEDLVKESFVPTATHNARTRKVLVRRRKEQQELSPLATIWVWVVDNQIGMPLQFSAALPVGLLLTLRRPLDQPPPPARPHSCFLAARS
jgi:hypothetical protein